MQNVTLESIQSEQARLAAMIKNFQAQQGAVEFDVPGASITLAAGELYAGIVLDDDGKPSHHLILLPGEATDISWQDARDWAAELGGELPTRREQSLLFANLPSKFAKVRHWSDEEYEEDPSYAWCQYFSYGFQYGYHKSAELRARAVRRLSIE